MSVPIPEKFYDLFSRPILCAFTTINPDGSPHSAPVWCDYDGARVRVNLPPQLFRSRPHGRDVSAEKHDPRLHAWQRRAKARNAVSWSKIP